MRVTIPPPLVYQTSALPNELTDNLVPRSGFEPLPLACKTSTLPLRHRGKLSTGRDSNPRWSFDYGFAGRCIRHSTTCAYKGKKISKEFWFRCQIKSLIEVSLSITIPLSARWDSNPRFQHTNYSSPSYQDGLVLAVFSSKCISL